MKTNHKWNSGLALAMILGVSSATLAKAETKTFERDGYTYVYEGVEKGETRYLTGKYYPGATPFSLRVRNGRVEGSMNGSSVSFRVSEKESDPAVQLTAR